MSLDRHTGGSSSMEDDFMSPTSWPSSSPFSEAMDTSMSHGSNPDLTMHPHLESSMRSLSTSTAARRKVGCSTCQERSGQQEGESGTIFRLLSFLAAHVTQIDTDNPLSTQEYAEKNAKLMAKRGQLMQGGLSRAEVVALMKRTRSVSIQ